MKIKLSGPRIKLRNFKLLDVKEYYENIKDEELAKWMDSIPQPYRKIDAIKFIIKNILYTLIKRKKREYSFGVVLKESDKVIGEIKLFMINWEDRSAEIGYWIGKKYWNKGFATEANKLIQKFGFEELNLNSIYGKIYANYAVPIRVDKKCGFKLKTIKKKARFKHGQWHDEVTYERTKSDYISDSSIDIKKTINQVK